MKFRNRKSIRLENWNYGRDGSYFITICTLDRDHFFGEIENGKMQLSPTGVIADILWYEIKNHAKNIELGEFVVMPNHIHGILILSGNSISGAVACKGPTNSSPSDPKNPKKNKKMAKISPKPNTISTIIRSYKSAVSKHCNRLGLEFGWQSRFHDHIIRSDESFRRISEYIKNNPSNWK